MSEASAMVQRVWNYCNVLRDEAFPMVITWSNSPTYSFLKWPTSWNK